MNNEDTQAIIDQIHARANNQNPAAPVQKEPETQGAPVQPSVPEQSGDTTGFDLNAMKSMFSNSSGEGKGKTMLPGEHHARIVSVQFKRPKEGVELIEMKLIKVDDPNEAYVNDSFFTKHSNNWVLEGSTGKLDNLMKCTGIKGSEFKDFNDFVGKEVKVVVKKGKNWGAYGENQGGGITAGWAPYRPIDESTPKGGLAL